MLFRSDLNEMDMDDEIEEGPISDPASCMETVKEEAADAAEDLKDLAKDAFEAVSYTHLDVYKRQSKIWRRRSFRF